MRIRLLDRLTDFANNKQFDETTTIQANYRALKNVREIKPTIKHYLRSQMASKFLRLDEEEYAPAIFLPVQDFRKATVGTVHAASRRMI